MCYVLICSENQVKRGCYQNQTIILCLIKSSGQVDIQFTIAAVTNCHKVDDLKQQKFSQFWRSEVQYQGVDRAVFPLKALGKNPSLLLPASGGCQKSLVVLGLQLHHSSPCLHQPMVFFPGSLCLPSLFSKKRHQSFDLGSALLQQVLILTNSICKHLIFK